MFLLAFPLILLAILGIGCWVIDRLRLTPDDPIQHVWIAGVLGLLGLGSLTTLLGFVQLLNPGALWLLVGGSIALTHREWRWLVQGALWESTFTAFRQLFWPWKVVLGVVSLLTLLYGLLAIAPNTQWDTLAHHFLVPEMYLAWGGIYDLQQVQMSYFPSLLQLMYALGMGTGGEQTAGLLGWWWSAWVLLGVLVVAQQVWRLEAGIAASALMLTQELYAKQLQGGWADGGVALFVLLGAWGALRWKQGADAGWLWTAGLAFGGALAASKHNALLPLVLVCLALLLPLARQKNEEGSDQAPNIAGILALKGVAILVAIALIPPACWYLRSWLLTGSPVYPLTLWGLFPGPELPVYAESSWIDRSYSRSIWNSLGYPFMLTYSASLLEGFQGRFPPQWPLLVPLVWWARSRHPATWWWTLLFAATLVVMFRVAPKETRYMLFAVPWLAVLASAGLIVLLERVKGATLGAVLVLGILLIPLGLRQRDFVTDLRAKLPVVLKLESRAGYIANASPLTARIAWMNAHLPSDAFVFCLEDRTYRLAPDWTNYYAATEPFPQTPEECYAFCWRQGITHLFLGDGTIIQPQILKNIVDLPVDTDGITRFTLGQVMFNMLGEPIDPDRHWVAWWTVRRMLQRAGFTSSFDDLGREVFAVPHDYLLSTPVQQAHYGVMGGMTGMADRGRMKLIDSDGLNMVFEFDYSTVMLYTDPAAFATGRPDWTTRQ